MSHPARVYPHDFASIPVDWGRVSAHAPWSGQVLIRKQHQIHAVSLELLDDAAEIDIWAMLRPIRWEQLLARAIYDARPDRRLRRASSRRWWALRRRLAMAVYPEHDCWGEE